MNYPHRLYILFSLVLIGIALPENGRCQNLLSADTLEMGKWRIEQRNDKEKILSYSNGIYKIIDTNSIKIVKVLNRQDYRKSVSYLVKYENDTAMLFADHYSSNKISVKDGEWKKYDSVGRLTGKFLYSLGIPLWYKDFDSAGRLTSTAEYDYINDTSKYIEYLAGKQFKVSYFHGGHPYEYYYGDRGLRFSNAELYFNSDLAAHLEDTTQIKIFAHSDAVVSLNNTSFQLKVLTPTFTAQSFPLNIFKGDSAIFEVVYHPLIDKLTPLDTIVITSREPNVFHYNIYAHMRVDQLAWLQPGQILVLSKSRDKFLIINSMRGGGSGIEISGAGLKETNFRAKGITKIDLNKFKIGTYNVRRWGEEFSAEYILKIID